MFRYAIRGKDKTRKHIFTVALTQYEDLAKFIANYGAEALDPDGRRGLVLYVDIQDGANMLVPPPRKQKNYVEDDN